MSDVPVVLLVVTVAATVLAGGIASAVVLLRRGRRGWGAVVATATVGLVTALANGPSVVQAIGASDGPHGPTALTPVATPVPPDVTWVPRAVDRGPGYAHIRRLRVPVFPAALRASLLRGPAPSLPAHGTIASVVIPATRSHFVARPAIVYLPPAARTAQPEPLPVVIAFSGQSRGAGPQDLVRSGDLRRIMDAIATRHHGVAPIVVVPDQLGPASGNPMCVDSEHYGHVATYVMRDVRTWTLDHLPVRADRRDWTVAGFSEGGTCALQFASQHPDVFGSFVDVSGEEAPVNGTLAHTIDTAFGGSRAAYTRATPAWILAHHRYRDEDAWFAAGALDHHYGPVAPGMQRRARAAGMSAQRTVIPGLAHNWRVASAAFRWAFRHLEHRWDL